MMPDAFVLLAGFALISRGTGREGVLSVDAWAKGMRQPITFVQEFRPYSSGAFRVRGDGRGGCS